MANKHGLALTAAREMARRHERGDYNSARDAQTSDDIDGWVGRRHDGRMVWPADVCDAAGLSASSRRRARRAAARRAG